MLCSVPAWGSGLIYWGVAEPMYHIQGSPFMERAGV